MGTKALVVAGVAAIALLAVIGLDVALTRTLTVDVQTGTGWRLLSQDPIPQDERFRLYPYGVNPVEANRSEDVRFRVGIDNEYPWGYSERYRVFHGNEEVTSGELVAGARERGESEFTISAERLLGTPGVRYDPNLKEAPLVGVEIRIDVGGKSLYASTNLREVTRS